MMLSPRDEELITASFAEITEQPDKFAQDFYQHLFALDTSVRTLFAHTRPGEQRRKLMQLLSTVVRSLSYLPSMEQQVRELGTRHEGYGVQPRHYLVLEQALYLTLQQHLGEKWTPEVELAWRRVYRWLAGTACAASMQSRIA